MTYRPGSEREALSFESSTQSGRDRTMGPFCVMRGSLYVMHAARTPVRVLAVGPTALRLPTGR
jgi:hypothetical protein